MKKMSFILFFISSLNAITSVELYNQGVTYAQDKEYVAALVAFKRAFKKGNYTVIAQSYPAIKMLEKELKVDSELLWPLWVYVVFSFVSLLLLQLLCIVIWFFLLWIYFYQPLFIPRWTKIVGAFLLVSSAGTLYIKYTLVSDAICIALKETPIFIGPHKNFHKVGALVPGQEAKVIKHDEDFLQIHSLKSSGWVQKEDVADIE